MERMDEQEENPLDERQEQQPADDSKETLELMKELFDGFNKTHLLEFIKLANRIVCSLQECEHDSIKYLHVQVQKCI